MKNTVYKHFWMLCLLACLALLAACEEVSEVSEYDNWQLRNEAYLDSIATQTGEVYISTLEAADAMETGRLFAILDNQASTTDQDVYVYCKKLTANPEGRRPLFTESVSAFYYGTLITGDSFDGNFEGYSATDQSELDGTQRLPSPFDEPSTFTLSGLTTGWAAALQFMRTGERWMLYVPYQAAYGTGGSGSIPGYSTLAFDLVLDEVVDE